MKAIETTNINIVQQNWTNNMLIPLVIRKFFRQGFKLTTFMLIICLLLFAGYLVTQHVLNIREGDVAATQEDTDSLLKKYLLLQENIVELNQLAEWKNGLSLAEQLAALGSFFNEKKCLLVNVAYYGELQNVPEKLAAEAKTNIERAAKTKPGNLEILGVWDISLRIPVSGLNTPVVRNNISIALQRDIANVFRATSANAILFTPDSGNSATAKTSDRLNIVIAIWNNRRGN